MDRDVETVFQAIRDSSFKTATAWAVKENVTCLGHYVGRTWAEKQWLKWFDWVYTTDLTPVRKAADTQMNNIWRVINAIVLKIYCCY